MNLDALGNLGDLLGGIGVIATLLYLAAQIRTNTREVRSASLHALTVIHLEFQRAVWQDAELTRIWFDGLSGDAPLAEADGRRFMFMLISAARQWETAYRNTRGGSLESSEWAGMHLELTRTFAAKGALPYWSEIRKDGFPQDFVEYAEKAVQKRLSEQAAA